MITPKRAKFESIAKLTMPDFFDTENVMETEILSDLEKYSYQLRSPITLDRVADILDEQNDILLLYHFIPSEAILCARVCCGVSNPEMEHMIRISAITDDQGLCDTIYLTIYNSLDIMLGEIMNERQLMLKRFNFGYEETYCTFLAFIS